MRLLVNLQKLLVVAEKPLLPGSIGGTSKAKVGRKLLVSGACRSSVPAGVCA